MLSTIFLVCLLTVVPTALAAHNLNSTYKFQAKLHDDYTLYWTFDNDAQNITFAVRVRTTGWVGFGVSPNGQMPQSDVVIGWIDGTGNNFDVSSTNSTKSSQIYLHVSCFCTPLLM